VKGIAPLLNGRPGTGAGHWASARPTFRALSVVPALGSWTAPMNRMYGLGFSGESRP